MRESHFKEGITSCLTLVSTALIPIAVLVVALMLLCGCTTTRYVEVPGPSHTDTVRITQQQRDSIFVGSVLHDSVVERQRGDTILIDRWHTRTLTEFRDRWRTDTVYRSRVDSIPFRVEVPVEKLVEKPLSRWQTLRIQVGDIALVLLLVLCGYGVFKLWGVWQKYH